MFVRSLASFSVGPSTEQVGQAEREACPAPLRVQTAAEQSRQPAEASLLGLAAAGQRCERIHLAAQLTERVEAAASHGLASAAAAEQWIQSAAQQLSQWVHLAAAAALLLSSLIGEISKVSEWPEASELERGLIAAVAALLLPERQAALTLQSELKWISSSEGAAAASALVESLRESSLLSATEAALRSAELVAESVSSLTAAASAEIAKVLAAHVLASAHILAASAVKVSASILAAAATSAHVPKVLAASELIGAAT